jgi:MFS family permease
MSDHQPTALELLDAQRFSRFHARAVVTTGMGVFTDGYDLISISVVLPMVLHSFGVQSLTGTQSSILVASALVASALGAILFGVLSNAGRKRFYGLDVTLMALAALGQAFTPGLWWLIAARAVLGFGIGADYVLSPMIMAEHSNTRDRGKALTVGFSMMWVLGAIAASLLQMGLEWLHVSPDLQWRITLGAGIIPAGAVIVLRRRLPETPRFFAHIKRDAEALKGVVAHVTGDATAQAVQADPGLGAGIRDYFARYWKRFAMISLLWFVYDIVIYAGGLFGPSLLGKSVGLTPAEFQLINNAIFSIGGSLVAVMLIDRWGRKPLQATGFLLMATMLMLYAWTYHPGVSAALWGILLYGLFFFFNQAGPGSISGAGMLGVEMAATRVRGLVQGLSVTASRIGAALGVFVFPHLFEAYGQNFAVGFLAVTALVGAVLTMIGIPESSGVSLEQASGEIQVSGPARV